MKNNAQIKQEFDQRDKAVKACVGLFNDLVFRYVAQDSLSFALSRLTLSQLNDLYFLLSRSLMSSIMSEDIKPTTSSLTGLEDFTAPN